MTPYEKFENISESQFNFNENKNRTIRKLLNRLGVPDTSVDESIYIRSATHNFSYQIFYEIFLEKQIYNRDLQFFNKSQLSLLKNIIRPSAEQHKLNEVGFGQIYVTKTKSIFYLSDTEVFLETKPEKIKGILNIENTDEPQNQFSEIFIGYPVDNSILNTTIILDKDFLDTPIGDFQTLIETSTAKEFYRYNKYLDIENKNEDTLNLLVKAIRLGMTEEQLNVFENEEVTFFERKQLFNAYLISNISSYINIFCNFRYRNPLIDDIYKDTIKFKNLIHNPPPSLEKLDFLNRLMPVLDDSINASQQKKALTYFSIIYQVPEFVDIENYNYIANFQLSKDKLEKLITYIEKFPDTTNDMQNESITTEQLRVLSTPQMSMKTFEAYLQIFLKHKSIDTFSVLKYVKPDKQHPVMIEKIIKTIEPKKENIKENNHTNTVNNTIEKESETISNKNNNNLTATVDTNTSLNEKTTNITPPKPQTMQKPKIITLDDIDDFDDFKDFKFYQK